MSLSVRTHIVTWVRMLHSPYIHISLHLTTSLTYGLPDDMGQRCAELVMCDILAQLARSRSGQGLAAAKWRSHQRTP